MLLLISQKHLFIFTKYEIYKIICYDWLAYKPESYDLDPDSGPLAILFTIKKHQSKTFLNKLFLGIYFEFYH